MCSCPIVGRLHSDAGTKKLEMLAWHKALLRLQKPARGTCIIAESTFTGKQALKSLQKLL